MAEPVGRPRKFATPEEFEKLADAYFDQCLMGGEPVTWTGLCLFVGMASRSGLDRYKSGEHGKEFCGPIKKALMRVENEYEKRLVTDGGSGPIFALKNFGWKDKQEIDMNATINHEEALDELDN